MTLYIGVTNNLERRKLIHESGINEGFSKKYRLNKLVYFEECTQIEDALRREKQLKNWHSEWKINLIRSLNPTLMIWEMLKLVQDDKRNGIHSL